MKYKLNSKMICQTISFVFLLCLASAWSLQVCCGIDGCFNNNWPFTLFPSPECPSKIGTTFTGYTDKVHKYHLTRTEIPSKFDGSKPTVFIVHGYLSNHSIPWVKGMKNALYDSVGDLNVVLVGWEKGAAHFPYYCLSASNTRTVGFELGELIKNMKAIKGLRSSNIHCIGHSLGAHVCAHAGSRTTIGRISGLDPAGPLFDRHALEAGLNKKSATFVDVIHTDGRVYGTGQNRGHMDFYPNGAAVIQPGCWTIDEVGSELSLDSDCDGIVVPQGDSLTCSHSRVHALFTESIKKNCFTAYSKCTTNYNIPGSCVRCTSCPKMGYWAKRTSSNDGIYYLTTSSGPSTYCL